MSKYISVDSIRLPGHRQDQGQDIADLVKDIREHKLKVPVLVNPKFELVDGQKRLRALRELGDNTVRITMMSDFDVAIAALAAAHQGDYARPSPRRIWEINTSLADVTRQRVRESKSHLKGMPAHSKNPVKLVPSRDLVSAALGFGSASYVSESIHLYNVANDPSDHRYDLAQVIVQELESGDLPVFAIRSRFERAGIFNGDITAPSEQKRMLNHAIGSLTGLIRSMEAMGPLSTKHNKTDKENWLRDLQALRRRLYVFVNKMETEIKK